MVDTDKHREWTSTATQEDTKNAVVVEYSRENNIIHIKKITIKDSAIQIIKGLPFF